MDIRPILEAQNPWWREPATPVAERTPVRRILHADILEALQRSDDRRALLLIGPRQVGKTTLLRQVIEDLLEASIPPANITYFDFSDDRLVEDVTPREVAERTPGGPDASLPRFFLFDEISRAPQWDLWLKQAVDHRVGRIVATDSAASVLRSGARESGQGRWVEHHLEGLSFREFLALQGRPAKGPRPPAWGRDFERYLALGGFPEHVFDEDLPEVRRRLRTDVVQRAILRDLADQVEDPDRVRRLFVYLMQESGSELVSQHRANDLGANRRSVDKWLTLLEETFLIERLERRQKKPSKRLASRPKLYAADHGLVTAFAASPDPVSDPDVRSRVFEAVAFRHLREIVPDRAAVTYLRVDDDLEADFVLDHPDGTVAIEVTHSRRVKAEKVARLARAAEVVGARKSLLIHGGLLDDGEPAEGEHQVVQVPLMRFLTEPEIALPQESRP